MYAKAMIGSVAMALGLCSNTSLAEVALKPMEVVTPPPMARVEAPAPMERVQVAPMRRVEPPPPMAKVEVSPIRRVEPPAPVAPVERRGIARYESGSTGNVPSGNAKNSAVSQGEFNAAIQRGTSLMKEKRFGEAVETFTHAIKASPDSDMGWILRGVALASMAPPDYGQAKQDLSKAIGLNPSNQHTFYYRALVNKATGQNEQYLSDMTMAAQLGNEKARQLLQAAAAKGGAAPQAAKLNQKGLSRESIDQGCAIVGEYIECPGQMHRFRHTFEMPQFEQNWEVYVPGVAYQTENVVDGTRWSHASVGANLPNNTLRIARNGTYLWKVRGAVIQGRWIERDDSHLILQKGYEGADWNASIEKFGADEVGRLLLWHDNEQLAGRLKK